MIEAVEYACRQASEYAQSASTFYCTAPETNGWEIATAIGTVGATVAALVFGLASWINQKRSEKRAENLRREAAASSAKEERRRNQENQFLEVVRMMKRMVRDFPFGTKEDQLWFQSQYQTYLRFLIEEEENGEIHRSAQQVLQLFGQINSAYSAETNGESIGYSGNYWAEENIVEESKGLLTMLAAQFDSILSYWHRTGEQRKIAEAGLVFLYPTVQDRFDEVEKEHRL